MTTVVQLQIHVNVYPNALNKLRRSHGYHLRYDKQSQSTKYISKKNPKIYFSWIIIWRSNQAVV